MYLIAEPFVYFRLHTSSISKPIETFSTMCIVANHYQANSADQLMMETEMQVSARCYWLPNAGTKKNALARMDCIMLRKMLQYRPNDRHSHGEMHYARILVLSEPGEETGDVFDEFIAHLTVSLSRSCSAKYSDAPTICLE